MKFLIILISICFVYCAISAEENGSGAGNEEKSSTTILTADTTICTTLTTSPETSEDSSSSSGSTEAVSSPSPSPGDSSSDETTVHEEETSSIGGATNNTIFTYSTPLDDTNSTNGTDSTTTYETTAIITTSTHGTDSTTTHETTTIISTTVEDKKEICSPNPCTHGLCSTRGDHEFDCMCDAGYRGAICNLVDENFKRERNNTITIGVILGSILLITLILFAACVSKLRKQNGMGNPSHTVYDSREMMEMGHTNNAFQRV